MAASVLCSSLCVMFLFVFPDFCFSNTIILTRDELLNIRQNTPQNLLPDFDYSVVLLDIVVSGAVALVKRFRTRRRSVQCRFRAPLPSIHLANLRSLANKSDKLLLSRTNKDFSNSAALFHGNLAEWRNTGQRVTSAELQIQLSRSDRDAESTGRSRGGGTCFYINERCCSDLETLFINCKPFYSQ